MLNVSGQAYITNLKEISPKLVVGDVYCHEKVSDTEFRTTFVNAKLVGEALVKVYALGIKNKDKFFIEKAILRSKEYVKDGKKHTTLELTVFNINQIEQKENNDNVNKFNR